MLDNCVMTKPALNGVLHPDDIEINRAGKISNRQKIVLQLRFLFWVCLASVEVFALTGVMIMQTQGNMPWILIIGISTLLVTMFYFCAINIIPYWKDLTENKVRTSSGVLYKHTSLSFTEKRGVTIAIHAIQVGGHTFSVSPFTYAVAKEGESYRLFYVPHSHTLVNIEELG